MIKKHYLKRIFFLAVLILYLVLPSCQKNTSTQKSNPIAFKGLKIKDIEMVDKIEEGYPIGADFNRNEVYIKSTIMSNRKFVVKIIDLDGLELVRNFELPAGNFQSPTEYFSPVLVEYIDHRYYVVDQFEKIVVYDEQFNHLYSDMYHELRYFIDICRHNREIFFLVCKNILVDSIQCWVKLYRLPENKKPVEEKDISPEIDILNIYNRNVDHEYHLGYFWPSVHGFEKEGRLYYGMGDKREIFVYDLSTGKKDVYSLAYLEAKKYTDEKAIKLGYHNTDGWEEKHFKQFGDKVIYEAYPGEMYHFGIYDIGVGRIGIAADVNLDKMTFRLDIIDVKDWEYKESIWLPIGYSFKTSLSTHYRGLSKPYINVDKGIFIYHDTVGEDFQHVTRITKFKVK